MTILPAAKAGHAQRTSVPGTSAPGKFERDISLPALDSPRQACVVLDGAAAAYAGGGQQQMTLWADTRPVPFTLTVNSPQESGTATAAIVNFKPGPGGAKDASATFDLQMPARPYSTVTLQFARHDVVMRATVSGQDGKQLGAFVLFDLTAKGGAEDTTLRLGERQDALLHVRLNSVAPGGTIPRALLVAAQVPPSRAEATLFTTIASATPKMREGAAGGEFAVAEFTVPQGVPVERVLLHVEGTQDFRRQVRVSAQPMIAGSQPDQVEGTIQRASTDYGGVRLRADSETMDAVLPDNQRSAMRVTVSVPVAVSGFGDSAVRSPLVISQVDLQMRQRQLCFAAWPGPGRWRLFYGAPGLQIVPLGSPAHSQAGTLAHSLVQAQNPVVASLGPQRVAANFHPLAERDTRAPEMLFAATMCFLALLALLVIVFLRAARIPHVRR